MADSSAHDSHAQPVKPLGSTLPTLSMGALETKFDKLLSLMETQTLAIREQTTAIEKELKDHGEKLETLRKDAVKNDQPFEQRELHDQQTWGAMNQEAVAMTKEAVGEWTTLMNVSLVFNAIFLAIVTAFIVPVLQGLQAPATDGTDTSADDQAAASGLFDPHRQEVIQQWIALFQVSAFALSIFNSALCVLGTQWGARLITRIKARNHHESTIQFERRKAIGKKWLLRLSGLLFSTLLLSILLFMVAFLLQAWVVAYAQPRPRPVLIAAAAIVSATVFTILIIVTVTTYHAVLRENSPFETLLSNVIRLLFKGGGNHEGNPNGPEDMLEVTKDDGKNKEFQTESEIYFFVPETLKVFASVAINSPEVEVLDKVAPSFRFGPWFEAGNNFFSLFEAAYDRFMATDTSIRVKETISEEFMSFWKLLADEKREETMKIRKKFRQWYSNQCRSLCNQSAEAHAKYFRFFAEVTSAQEGNEDLREIAEVSYKESIGRVLSSYDQEEELGNRTDLFDSAVQGCISLLQAGKEDDVREIISGRHSSIIRSMMRTGRDYRPINENLLRSFILQGRAQATLTEISPLLSDPLFVCRYDVNDILAALVSLLPSDFTLTSPLDLSHLLATVSRQTGRPSWSNWEDFTDATLFLLGHGAFDMLSDVSSAYIFLKRSIENLDISYPASKRASSFLDQHAERFSGSFELSADDRASLIADLSVFAREPDFSEHHARDEKFLIALNRYHVRLLGGSLPALSQNDSLLILQSIVRNPIAKWDDIESLVSRMKWSDVAIWRVISAPENLANLGYVDDDLLPLRFLSCLKERNFILPSKSDLSPLLACITRHEPHSESWRTHGNALTHYIAQGDAIHRLTDRDSARKFFTLCANEPEIGLWDYRGSTSEETRRQAKEYLKKLDPVKDHAASSRVMKYWYMTRATIARWLGHIPSVDRTPMSISVLRVPHSTIEMEDLPPIEDGTIKPDTGSEPEPTTAHHDNLAHGHDPAA
ncbi:hypothetical protein SISSUDRAFT_1040655 [Sistotremastrum suecicum HHB10207 ss-3]|uniref:DUF6535 domain-containing protein n=1 Tax=Sistotremastrum suecicum HHB10207 ss-3 TaxID=1314776 RepID=A0A166HYD8_9AGAM|nr:hypothetical protein SISSUDRAFT_1040655 [Sistotremastrum suecicum HHB10207 ss-3]